MTRGDVLRYAIAYALLRAREIVRGLREALTEEHRFAVADHGNSSSTARSLGAVRRGKARPRTNDVATRLWRDRAYLRSAMFVSRELQRELKRLQPCLPRPAKSPPAGPGWIHEIKHDGFRILAEREGNAVTLHSRKGFDFAERFPLAAAAVGALRVRSCLIDGEAIVCDANGLAVLDLLRRGWHGAGVILCAFDLLEVDGADLRRAPIEERKAALAKLLRRPPGGIVLNEHYTGDGAMIYKHACALGCEGIVSKRLGSPYRAGRADCWIKVKNPAAPAVTREAEEEWN